MSLHGPENGVSLNKVWHANNTLKAEYYQRVLKHFENASSKTEFLKRLDDLAESLQRESRKLKKLK